jgi:hypothetical protein
VAEVIGLAFCKSDLWRQRLLVMLANLLDTQSIGSVGTARPWTVFVFSSARTPQPGENALELSICEEIQSLRSVRRLLVTAVVVPSSPILVTLMMVALFLRNVGSYKNHTA